jgi:type I restriction enzyme S subunit
MIFDSLPPAVTKVGVLTWRRRGEGRKTAEAQLAAARGLSAAYLREVFDGREAQAWPRMRLVEFVKSFRNGFGRRPAGEEEGPIILRIADVSGGFIDLSAPRRGYMTAEEQLAYNLVKGDALFIRVNGSSDIVGRCIPVSEQHENVSFNDHLIRVQLSAELDAEYLSLVCDLPEVRACIVEQASTSAGQLTVNQQILSNIYLPAPSLSSQLELVRCIKQRKSACSGLTIALENQLIGIEAMPAAYLQQAFNGEL